MKRVCTAAVALGTAISAVCAGHGQANAGLDDEHSVITPDGRTLTIKQWDTLINGVAPLDRNRLTREWFHHGRATYSVEGPAADEFVGTLELGYQVSFPWVMGVGLNFSYHTPNIANYGSTFEEPWIETPPLLPGPAISVNLGNGPGIKEVATVSVDVSEPTGSVSASGAHGTVTGAAGGVLLRPFARLYGENGESVATYGEPWNMN